MGHEVSASEFLSQFRFNSQGELNPDTFYIYEMSHNFDLTEAFSFNFTFGLKMTRYEDGDLDYSYSNEFGMEYFWKGLLAGIFYRNGGFTDQGYVDFWYFDDFRRIVRINLSYTF